MSFAVLEGLAELDERRGVDEDGVVVKELEASPLQTHAYEPKSDSLANTPSHHTIRQQRKRSRTLNVLETRTTLSLARLTSRFSARDAPGGRRGDKGPTA
jgi:hypothetical protein